MKFYNFLPENQKPKAEDKLSALGLIYKLFNLLDLSTLFKINYLRKF